MEPKIYVACLAAYNSGILHGAYIDATLEPDEMLGLIGDMLKNSPIEGAEEWDIHDYDDFGHIDAEDLSGLQHIQDVACFIAEHDELGAELMNEFSCDVNQAKQYLDNRYIGEYDSMEDYAMELCYDHYDIPEFIAYHVDCKAMALELSYDLLEIEVGDKVHLFHNN